MLDVQNVTVRYGQQVVVNHLSFTLLEGQWMMLVGPNGAGKSSLIAAISQSAAYNGTIRYQGQDIRTFKPNQLAQKIGILAQRNHVGYAYTVEEIVRLGRYAHARGIFGAHDDEGEILVEEALRQTGMEALRNKSMLTLSGGEVQRAFLAQVFAQNPQLLILDEPANHLDLVYQRHIFALIQQWAAKPGRAVLSVVHDLSLARRYGTHAVLMDGGKCLAQGCAEQVFTPDNLTKVYRMDVYTWMREMLSAWNQEN